MINSFAAVKRELATRGVMKLSHPGWMPGLMSAWLADEVCQAGNTEFQSTPPTWAMIVLCQGFSTFSAISAVF